MKLNHILKTELKKVSIFFKNPTFIFLTLGGNLLLLVATATVYWLEKDINPHLHTFFDSLWWSASTITTVGYGDVVPVTFLGRIIGITLMYTGTVLFISLTGLFLGFMLKEEVEREIAPLERDLKKEEKETQVIMKTLHEINRRLEKLEKKL